MRRFWFVCAVVVAVVLQVAYVPAMRPFGVVPDLLMVVVVLVGLDSTVSRALIVGVNGGLLLDLSSGADFGLRTVLYVLLALAAGLVHRSGVELVGPLIALGLTALGTIVQTVAIVISVAPHVTSWDAGYVASRLGIELMVNLGLVVLLHPLVRWLVREPGEPIGEA